MRKQKEEAEKYEEKRDALSELQSECYLFQLFHLRRRVSEVSEAAAQARGDVKAVEEEEKREEKQMQVREGVAVVALLLFMLWLLLLLICCCCLLFRV